MQESFRDLSCQRNIRRVNTFESTQRETEIENISHMLSSSGRTLVHLAEAVKEGTSS
jgi:hypothetical protein